MDLIAQFLEAAERLKALGPPPAREFRLHPDDMAELKAAVAPHAPNIMWPIGEFGGLDIVIDENATRLPRAKRE
jgi:hypothetical protein